MDTKRNDTRSWISEFSKLALAFKEKSAGLSEAIEDMPVEDVSIFLKRHANLTIEAFRTAQSLLFRKLGEEEYDIGAIRSLFIEMSRRFDEMQALFFASIERYDRKDGRE